MAESKPRQTAGYYRQRGKNSYELDYRRHRKTVKAKNDTEAARLLAKFVADVDSGKFKKPSRMTVKQLAVRFLRDNSDLSEATKENYAVHLNNRILPVFEDMKIAKVKPTHIYDFMSNLAEDGIRKDGKSGGLAPATIQKNLNILSSMFSFAVDMGEMEENPCAKVKPPRIPKRKKASIDRDPARDMLRALRKESLKYRCITLISACTGMRRGEILGIGDSTLDLNHCTITINRASRHMPGGEIPLNDPKSERSKRIVPFPPDLVPLLQEMIMARDKQREKCGDKWVDKIEVHGEIIDNDLLFTQWNGKPMHPNTVTGWFAKFRDDNDLPKNLKFHGLRHTNITQLLKSGVDVGTVADLAGHANKTTTLDYDDPDVDALRGVATKISDALALDSVVPDLLNQPVNVRRKRKRKA